MKLLPTAAAAAISLSGLACAQRPVTFTDPANLRGERVTPSDGRELPVDQGARGLEQMLRKLNTRASLMLIVAHPDDEDGGLLTYYSRGLGARVAMLTLNRGEGGQNAMTGDFEDALGLLRTQELLAADRYMGVDQMFGTEVDFGFSKTKEEAFSKWTHERVLYDAVRAVRLYRPLIIASVFIGGVTDGHGQHQVAGEIAQEVFKAAGDPKLFPELTAEGILPWQPLKVYARVPVGAVTGQGLFDYATGQYTPARFVNYVTGEVTTTIPSTDAVIHEGNTDPLLTLDGANATDLSPALAARPADAPLSYVQFARIGLGLQRTQIGPGVRTAPAGAFDISYHLYGTRLQNPASPESDAFFAGVDTSVPGIQQLDSVALPGEALTGLSQDLRSASERYNAKQPASIAPLLAHAARDVDLLLEQVHACTQDTPEQKANALHELQVKRIQINQALLLALGLRLRADASAEDVATGQTVNATIDLTKTSKEHVVFRRLSSANSEGQSLSEGGRDVQEGEEPHLSADHPVGSDCGLDPPYAAHPTRPYFFRRSVESPVYELLDPALRNAPATPPALTCIADVSYNGVRVELGAVVTHAGQPLALVPPVNIALSSQTVALPRSAHTFQITAFDRSLDPHAQLANIACLGSECQPTGSQAGPVLRSTTTRFAVHGDPAKPFEVQAFVRMGDPGPAQSRTISPAGPGFRPVGYGTLPRTNLYTPALATIVPIDLALPQRRRVAYLAGTGDAVPEALASVGLPPVVLSVADLTPEKLAQFDTLVLGVRTYNAHPELHGAPTEALLNFARSGGNVIVQYQTAEFTGGDAPFPLTLGNAEKVVDENAPVRLLDPSAPVLTSPNRLTEADFHGWIEERGHGFLRTWDDRYTAPTETHDPGSTSEGVAPQAPQRGGLVTVRLGKGHWTYCAFALYRQLPEAVPGAYRLFSNLLALADER